MISKPDKNKLRLKRRKRIRSKISGTAERPRLSIFRSNKNIYAQLIDDVAPQLWMKTYQKMQLR